MIRSTALHGTRQLIRLNVRVDRVRASLWLVGVVGLVLVSAWSVRSLYSTPEQIAGYASILDVSPAMENVNRAMNGPGFGFDDPNVGVVLANEIGLWGGVSFALMAIFLMARHTRGEEESGRVELVRSRPAGRHAPLAAAATLVLIAQLVAGSAVLVGLAAMGFDAVGAGALSLAFVAVGCVFAAATAVSAQVLSTGRATIGVGLGALGIAFVLRAIGDMGSGSLSWLSPLGWVHRVRPFAGEQWWVLSLSLGSSLFGAWLTWFLAAHRDLGSGMVAQSLGPDRAKGLTTHTLGLLIRLQRGSIVAWTLGVSLLGLAYGAVAADIEEVFADNPDLERFIPTGGSSAVDAYLAYTLSLGALLTCAAAIASILRLRREEVEGRAELVLAHPVSRWSWLGRHLVVAAGTAVLALGASGVGTGVGVAMSSGEPGRIVRLTGASLALLPLPVVLVGFTTFMVGALPRFAAASWASLAFVVVVAILGDVFNLAGWVRSISPMEHLSQLPAEGFDPVIFGLVSVSGALLAMLGAVAYRRRDVPS